MIDLKIPSDEELRRDYFDRKIVVVKNFLPPELISAIHAVIPRLEFEDRRYEVRPQNEVYEGVSKNARFYRFINDALNDPRFLKEVMELTGEKDLIGYWGRLYCLRPDNTQRMDWHKDLDSGKRVAISINISPRPFTGGELILRQLDCPQSEIKVHNIGEGDAVFFTIDPAYEHRVLPVSGDSPKYAITGWFQTMAPPDPA